MIGNIAGAIAGIVDTGMSYVSARRSESFQRHMYDTRYQRTMADMRKAGLNPMLAYSQGPGSAPRGPGAQKYEGAAKAVSTALAIRRASAELKNINEDTELKNEQAWLTRNNASVAAQQYDIDTQNLATAKAVAAQARIEEAIYRSPYGKAMKVISVGAKSLNPFGPLLTRAARR